MANLPLYVVVLPLTVDTQVHAKDTNVAGIYELIADTGWGEGRSAALALETFHDKTPISFPENFLITVIDPILKRVIEPIEIDRALELPYRKVSGVVPNWLSELADAGPVQPPKPRHLLRDLFVVVRALRPFDELHVEDKRARGLYMVTGIERSMSEMEQAETALQSLRTTVPFKMLEDFEITVVEPVTQKILPTGLVGVFQTCDCDKVTTGISQDLLRSIAQQKQNMQAAPEAKSPARRCEEDDPSPQF